MTLDGRARSELQGLVSRLAGGDRAAFDPVFDRVAPLVRALASRAVPASDVDDVVQEAMLRVFLRASELDPERPALPWILGIAAWECRTLRKKRARRREDAEVERVSERASPEDEVIARDLRSALEEAIGSLSPRDVETILAASRGEESDVGGATFRKRLSRAVERLREAWRSHHG